MTTYPNDKQTANWITEIIQDFCAGSENTLQNAAGEKAWSTPLVGFARGDDPLFTQYKEVVGPFHWTPQEIFATMFPNHTTRPEDLTVICWILPQTDATKRDNRKQTTHPAERWARSRIFGEAFNRSLREHVVNTLQDVGILALSPMLTPQWQVEDSERFVFASTWSERHAAYAAGLGTFGLCDGLITPVGKAMRVGSVIAKVTIPPTPRPYTDHHEYCLFYTHSTCGKCIERCPVGALSAAGHDKRKCRKYLDAVTKPYVTTNYGFDGYGCGLCQTGVPCESKIPLPSEG